MSYGENIALGEFEVNVNANNFSQLGTHAYIIECFTYNEVGFVSGEFEVTPSGSFIDTQESILIIGSLFLMIVISSIFFIIAYKSDKIVLKTSFFVASAIFFTATLLYMVIALQQSLWNIPAVLVGAESFWFMIRMLLTIGFVSLMILIALLLLKSWRIKRGLLDE